jgi:hypothetical protein
VAAVDENLRSPNGNPIAQARCVARLKKNETILGVDLAPGKKGNFSLTIVDFGLWNAGKDCEASVLRPHSRDLWLACWRNEYTFKHGAKVDDKCAPRLLFTYHSLHRMAERCGARSPQDLITALNERLPHPTSSRAVGSGKFLPTNTTRMK